MEETIKKFSDQFKFEPVIENELNFSPRNSFVLCGMGGSHLSAGLIKIYNPNLDIYIHRDYGLPLLSEKRFKESLFIASSYSGNTEEVIDFAKKAREKKYNLAVVAIGGKLIEFAKKNSVPYIKIPDTGIEPRCATGFSIVALAKLLEGDEAVTELHKLGTKLNPLKWEEQGKKLASDLEGKIPLVYTSRSNLSIAYNWKIKFNETSKIPAFHNVFPELNHNEMAGFDRIDSTKKLSDKFYFIFIEDSDDHPKIMRRMEVTRKLFMDRELPMTVIPLTGHTVFEKIFNSLTLADWTALHLSRIYETVADKVLMVEEFKKLIA